MSTEARHAPVPPHRPSRGPAPTGDDATEGEPRPEGARDSAPAADAGADATRGRTPQTGAAPGRTEGADSASGSRTAAGRTSSDPRTASGGAASGSRGPAAPVRPGSGTPAARTAGDVHTSRPGSGSPDPWPRFPYLRPAFAARNPTPAAPPPPASARFPDAPPAIGREPGRERAGTPAGDGAPPRPGNRPAVPHPRTGAPAETPAETTARLRPIPSAAKPEPTADQASEASGPTAHGTRPPSSPPDASPRAATASALSPDPALSWSAALPARPPMDAGRPVVSLGQTEGYDERGRPRPLGARVRPRTAAAAACVVLGLGLIGGAVTGSWLTGGGGSPGTGSGYTAAADLWHSVPVDQLFPPTVEGTGAGPGGADRTWTRIAVAPDSGCAHAFDRLLRKALAPVGCRRLLRATYTDATQSYVTTVGLLFTKADAAAMTSLARRFQNEGLDRRGDLMPRPYAAKDTVAADFGAKQRASWTISVLTDAPVVAYAVSGWADGRPVDDPQPAAEAMSSGATSAPAQAGLGNEAQGLADRIERRLRKTVSSATESPS
ncbi:hypothetical protein [Streptomyces sp. NPDC051636]|uniref:hypothetical protein n=1 Tax=Streptomyces sp. NPDC051636 TaxID=3365663 RepID=UPI0037947348